MPRTNPKMKRSLQILSSAVALVLASAVLPAATASAAPIMNIEVAGGGPDGVIGLGDTVTVSLYGNDIPVGTDGNGLFGFGFSILFDDAVLSTAGPTAGPLWVGVGFSEFRNDPGDAGALANRFFAPSGPSGNDILLASLDFTGDAIGLSNLTVGYYTGPGDNILFDSTVLDSSLSFFQSGSINVVPEPQTGLLLGMGLAFLAVRRRNQLSRRNS